MLQIINWSLLEAIDEKSFCSRAPYPWVNLEETLSTHAQRELPASLPEFSRFTKDFGRKRAYGQKSHDRYILEWEEGMDLSPPWSAFIDELGSERYRKFIERVFGRKDFTLRFHWHFSQTGSSISPHCDGERKIGSQIFYLNTEEDWNPEWGGQTLVLDDQGKKDWKSSPNFDDFNKETASSVGIGSSFIFARTPHAWHGVKSLTCPEGKYRKVFIVVIDRKLTTKERIKNLLRKIITH